MSLSSLFANEVAGTAANVDAAGAASNAGAAGAGAEGAGAAGVTMANAIPTVGGNTMATNAVRPTLLDGKLSIQPISDEINYTSPSFRENFMTGMTKGGNPVSHLMDGEFGKALGSYTNSALQSSAQKAQAPAPSSPLMQFANQRPAGSGSSMDRYNQLYRFRR